MAINSVKGTPQSDSEERINTATPVDPINGKEINGVKGDEYFLSSINLGDNLTDSFDTYQTVNRLWINGVSINGETKCFSDGCDVDRSPPPCDCDSPPPERCPKDK